MATTLWLAGIAVATSSCAHQPPRAFLPPPAPVRVPVPEVPAPELALPEEIAFAPAVYDFPSQTDPSARFPILVPPRPPRTPVVATPKPVVPASGETPAVTPPKLAQILTPEESRRNTQELDQYEENVRRALARVAGKNLNAELKDVADRVRTFLSQAEQAREQDLVTAVSLAKRADLLAKDLLERLP